MLKIGLENKHSKFFICLDREDYTVYLDEKEVLLQAGLLAEVKGFYKEKGSNATVFDLFISDEMVKKQKRKRRGDFVCPVAIYCFKELITLSSDIRYIYTSHTNKMIIFSVD